MVIPYLFKGTYSSMYKILTKKCGTPEKGGSRV